LWRKKHTEAFRSPGLDPVKRITSGHINTIRARTNEQGTLHLLKTREAGKRNERSTETRKAEANRERNLDAQGKGENKTGKKVRVILSQAYHRPQRKVKSGGAKPKGSAEPRVRGGRGRGRKPSVQRGEEDIEIWDPR